MAMFLAFFTTVFLLSIRDTIIKNISRITINNINKSTIFPLHTKYRFHPYAQHDPTMPITPR